MSQLERKIISVGRQLLSYTKIDRFHSVSFVTSYLADRDHLLDKAAMFLAKAYIVFREKLASRRQLHWRVSPALQHLDVYCTPCHDAHQLHVRDAGRGKRVDSHDPRAAYGDD